MNSVSDLAWWANIAAIAGFVVTFIGACVGIYGYWAYRRSWNKKTKALVDYLRSKKDLVDGRKKGQHTATHIIRYVGLTKEEILKISFESKHVRRTVDKDEHGKADTLYFEYEN